MSNKERWAHMYEDPTLYSRHNLVGNDANHIPESDSLSKTFGSIMAYIAKSIKQARTFSDTTDETGGEIEFVQIVTCLYNSQNIINSKHVTL